MIIWGKGGGTTDLGELGEQDCPTCEKRTPFHATLQYTYRHIWYLISWVTGREYHAVCRNCGNGSKMNKAEAKKNFPKDGIPFIRKKGWLIGFFLAGVIIGVAMMNHAQDRKQYQAYINEPQIGDIYLARMSSIPESGYDTADKTAYGFMALVQIKDENRVFVVSKHAYSKKKGVRKELSSADSDAYDMNNPLVLAPDEVRDLFEKKIIYEIRRK